LEPSLSSSAPTTTPTAAAFIAVTTGLLSGLAPALQAPATGIVGALREGDRQTNSRRQGRLRAALVTGEVALSFVLLVGAGLLTRSFGQLMTVDRGFETENRLVFSLSLPDSYYENGVGKQFMDRFFERLAALPEVVAAGAVSHRPVEGGDPGMNIDAASAPQGREQRTAPWAGWRVVSPTYFKAVGLPLRRGRMFDESDKPVWAERGQPPPQRRVVISERLATQIFPNEDPVGKHVLLWAGQGGRDAEVIGVIADSRERGPAADPTLTVYLPYGRNALPGEIIVHTRGNPLALMPAVRSIVTGLDSNLPIGDVRSFEEVVYRSVAPQRFNALLLGASSWLALLLATTGIYGVLSYSMGRRTSEIGLRVALGASGASILRMAVGQGLRPALLGVVLGAAGAWWLSRYAAVLLVGIEPFDAPTYAAVAVLLLVTALAACYVPGRRAMRIDPAVALRTE
jgi:putative ABC transport system permease protein